MLQNACMAPGLARSRRLVRYDPTKLIAPRPPIAATFRNSLRFPSIALYDSNPRPKPVIVNAAG